MSALVNALLYVLSWAWIVATAAGLVWALVYLGRETAESWREWREES